MHALDTAIWIDVEPAEVWRALSDFSRYPEWNPLLRRVDGELRPGAQIRLSIKLAGLPAFRLPATIRNVLPGKSFDWTGALISPAIFEGNHQFRLITHSKGTTLVEHCEHYSGLLSFIAIVARPLLRRGFQEMNDALRRSLETKSRSTSGNS